ncbi:CAAX protease family protein [Mycobacterium antarcticum]|uniref:Rv0804 family intramembrane glutamic endopeptidase n=1 Tax=Mycolicibacterium sp. TUM20983 TaxID=3023369 RepID=UPI00238885E0|nr:CPBP family intramembrane glutamic endopeptidase [Mycolicibacterium sp. TUM20983]GLP73717.1 CAAX protease family protein [Mycolicibacterium sp. TUM20983]
MRCSTFRALSLALALIGWSGLVAPRLPPRWLVPAQAALGGLLVATTDAPLGFRPPASRHGARLGLAVAAVVTAVVAASTVVPAVRRGMLQRELPRPAAAWLLVRIPVGTVWSEEAAFRAALGTVAARAFGPTRGRVLQAATFGLSHVADARGTGESVAGTVLVTGVAGWLFGWLYDRSGSLLAPMLAHLAINEAGALAALAVKR